MTGTLVIAAVCLFAILALSEREVRQLRAALSAETQRADMWAGRAHELFDALDNLHEANCARWRALHHEKTHNGWAWCTCHLSKHINDSRHMGVSA